MWTRPVAFVYFLRVQFLTFADRWQPTPLGRVPRDAAENRLAQQLVSRQAGVEEGLSSLEAELGGAGDAVGGGAGMTAGLEGFSWKFRTRRLFKMLPFDPKRNRLFSVLNLADCLFAHDPVMAHKSDPSYLLRAHFSCRLKLIVSLTICLQPGK